MQEVLEVPNEVAAELAGIGDGVLGALRDRLGCAINLRGNRLTLDGDDTKVVEAKAVLEELVELVEFRDGPRRELASLAGSVARTAAGAALVFSRGGHGPRV